MLPARSDDAASLADVLASSWNSVRGEPDVLGLNPARRRVVVLVDGLGSAVLDARRGHARTLSRQLDVDGSIDSGFPTTTAVAITSLTTGLLPGQHGIVGYSALDPRADRVVNMLTGWGPEADPLRWQPHPTVFENAVATGSSAVAVGPERYRDSGFTAVALRGARYVGARTLDDRVEAIAHWLREARDGVAYLYIPELDSACHAHGWRSAQWIDALEAVDFAIATLSRRLRVGDSLLVTADHGVIDVGHDAHVLVDERPQLLDGVRHLAGEPRCLQLHLEASANADEVASRWRDAEGERAWIATRSEAILAGWFGTVDPVVEPRLGDVFVAAREPVAYYDSRTAGASRGMIGQHGSLSSDERRVPLLRFDG